MDEADYDLLRPLVSATEAEVFLERLKLAPESFSEDQESKRSLYYIDVYDSGSLEEQVDALRAITYDPRGSTAESQNRKRFEQLVHGELATALGVTPRTLRNRLAKSAGVAARPGDLLPDRTEELRAVTTIAPMDNMRTLGAFYVESEIGAGAEGVEVKLSAKPGVWFAYGHSFEDALVDDESPDVLLAIHSEHQMDLAVVADLLEPVGERVPIHGAWMCIADVTAAADRRFAEQMMERGETLFQGRAARLYLGGDGSCQVAHASAGGKAFIVQAIAD